MPHNAQAAINLKHFLLVREMKAGINQDSFWIILFALVHGNHL